MAFVIKMVHLFLWPLGMALFKIFFKFQVKGKENLKGLKGPLIIVANHGSWLDAFLMCGALPFGSKIFPVRFAAWYKYYWRFFPFSWLAGIFPVMKGRELDEILKESIKILEKGGTVGMFPEGKRRHFGRKRKGRRGTAFLALKTNSQILPMLIEENMGLEIIPCLLRKRKIKVTIGKPFRFPPQPIKSRSDLNNPADLIVEKIYQLE